MVDYKSQSDKGVTMICNSEGVIEKIIPTEECSFREEYIGKMLCTIVEKDSINKCLDFLAKLKNERSVFNWEMLLKCNQQRVYNVSGAYIEDKILIFAAEYRHDIIHFLEQTMKIQNDYLTLIRRIIKEKKGSTNDNVLEDYSKLNNELINIQRELIKKNELLEKQDEHIKLMNQILRHDLANQFSVIISAVNLYREEKDETMLSEIKSKAYSGIEMIRKMRNLDKLYPQKRALQKMMLKEVLERVKSQHSDIEIEVFGEAVIQADDSIFSLLNNLIENAKTHGGATKVSIAISKEKDNISVVILNNGSPIPETITEKVFDQRFSYGKKANTGLGLFIAKKIMEFYGGTIFVKNREDKGVEFTLKFPIK